MLSDYTLNIIHDAYRISEKYMPEAWGIVMHPKALDELNQSCNIKLVDPCRSIQDAAVFGLRVIETELIPYNEMQIVNEETGMSIIRWLNQERKRSE